MNALFKTKWPLFLLLVLAIAGCSKDDDSDGGGTTDELVASFTSAVSADNPLAVDFTNISANATGYSWDFGDSNTSTEESPTHIYAGSGTFTVVLTASDATDSKTFSRDVLVVDPNATTTFLAGSGSKTWYLQREGIALGIGEAPGVDNYWSFGGVAPLGERPCILDDSWIFNADGTVIFESNETIFIDSEGNGGWLGPAASEGCYDEAGNLTAATGEDVSAFGNGGDYTYDHDVAGNSLTVDGDGFYIGLANKTADMDNPSPLSTKTYEVFKMIEGTVADTLQLSLNSGAGTNSWNFYLVSYKNAADLPDIPGASAATAGFNFTTNGFDVAFSNTSTSATSYSWDFGDGGSSTDASPSHTYAAEGNYEVTLTAMGAGGDDTETKTVSINSVTYSPAVLSNAAGKIWKLDGANSYYVGEGAGGNNYWPGVNEADVVTRACQFDDEFIFSDDGTLEYDTKGEVWAEGYMLGADACAPDGDLVSPYDVFGSGTHAFTAAADQVTVNGNGAFLGFNKPYNGGEHTDGTSAPVSSITYEVIGYELSGTTERVTISVNYGVANDFWSMRLVSEN
ncbi:MAG: PKD repeat protein [Polaribacter sp.]|jgi:PKD repeat protein